jgi:hypothetical protein
MIATKEHKDHKDKDLQQGESQANDKMHEKLLSVFRAETILLPNFDFS